MKYTYSEVTFREFPDEISLCINLSNCPHHCKGCHSPELWEDIGTELSGKELENLINKNKGISCLGLMGGDSDISWIVSTAGFIKEFYPNLKVGWYSGNKVLHKHIDLKDFDYVKLGPYIEEKGPLDNPNTNQRLFWINHSNMDSLEDITFKFWKNNEN